MNEEDLDEDGYPTDAALSQIENWPISDNPLASSESLMLYVGELWMYKEWGWARKDDVYNISTGGWSGNESLIQSMKKNTPFWAACWQATRRGGHYEFKLPTWML